MMATPRPGFPLPAAASTEEDQVLGYDPPPPPARAATRDGTTTTIPRASIRPPAGGLPFRARAPRRAQGARETWERQRRAAPASAHARPPASREAGARTEPPTPHPCGGQAPVRRAPGRSGRAARGSRRPPALRGCCREQRRTPVGTCCAAATSCRPQ